MVEYQSFMRGGVSAWRRNCSPKEELTCRRGEGRGGEGRGGEGRGREGQKKRGRLVCLMNNDSRKPDTTK